MIEPFTEVRVFTRDQPCTKVDIFNCFYRRGQFRDVPVTESLSLIGRNAPLHMLRKGYLYELPNIKGIDYYRLSPSGVTWLIKKLRRHLELHPEDEKSIAEPIPEDKKPTVVLARRPTKVK